MSNLTALFLKRIGYTNTIEHDHHETITFEKLPLILELASTSIPFENLRVLTNRTRDITREHLIEDILIHNEGGICYELNALFYLFLLDNGFDAAFTRAIIYENEAKEYIAWGRTHVAILLKHEGQTYLVDAGVGGNMPLKPVPLTGETVTSNNGEFRVTKVEHALGDYVYEIKLKHKDTDWHINYIFDSNILLSDLAECTEVQQIVIEHPDSHFNKGPLITKLTSTGNITLTANSFTQWENGVVTKEQIDGAAFSKLLQEHFGLK
ncbi:arylamine N-acetyltransferase family protein [Paenibacillus agilis]|uniref:Arylamine N-acetyltransferase n=1 Tax=Paenibacillus agilis TaxID=3020863 RepID=A0A559IXX2_9BACL|nr:arylamine N-acetyltransferase [Paenibacillus agilis]TVX92441.1 arylamine N-acetyltransferase [Paenibacillus agilis]